MNKIKNHKLDAKLNYGNEWAATKYFFCIAWLPETQKISYYKKVIDPPDSDIIDKRIFDILMNNESYIVIPEFTAQIIDEKKTTFLWYVDYKDDYCYFNANYVGWILYRLNKLKIENIVYRYIPMVKMLLILIDNEVVAGVMGLNISKEEVNGK